MNETLFFSVAVFVFIMMAIGLGLTVWEFSFGQPRREAGRAPARVKAPESHRVRDSLVEAPLSERVANISRGYAAGTKIGEH